jgi:hypothetical protein
MKRLVAYNGLVAMAFWAYWALLVVVEVKVQPYWFLPHLFFGSLPLVFIGVFFGSWRALSPGSKHPAGYASLLSAVVAPAMIFVGVVIVTNFKFLIGGSL